ncbi:MAG: VWA domain-containing protein [Bdellovibrionales bacterium]|nr:VWA domain-containing protein [Bdellovibrionales bacterium]
MSFENLRWWPLLLLLFILFGLYRTIYERQFFRWVGRYWFYRRSRCGLAASWLYMFGFGLLVLSLFDLRGSGVFVEHKVPDQKSVILLDLSASMLVEDIKPNRLGRAIFLARHFVKKSVGHQIAVLLFSDNARLLLPFTSDIDLVDSRLKALEQLNMSRGSSNLEMALQEAVQLIKIDTSEKDSPQGNILLFSDLETNRLFKLPIIPASLAVAVVGMGTIQGGKIPIRDQRGILQRYKKYKGKEVVSKLNEKELQRWAKSSAGVKYWYGATESLPSRSIHHHFRSNHQVGLKKQNIQQRPVYSTYLASLAVLLLAVTSILQLGRSFAVGIILGLFVMLDGALWANSSLDELLNKVKYGESTRNERLEIASLLVSSGELKRGIILFEENIGPPFDEDINYLFNLGSAYLKEGRLLAGAKIYHLLRGRISRKYSQQMAQNVLLASSRLAQQQQRSSKKQKQKNSDKNGKGKKKSSSNRGKSAQKREKKNDGLGKPTSSGRGEKQKKKQVSTKSRGRNLEEKEQQIRRKRKLTSVPALIKQIMGEDHQLQRKYISTSNKSHRRKSSESGKQMDW